MALSQYKGCCVMVLGTVSLQQYIFRSNRLKENIGASYLVKHWFERGLIDTLKRKGFTVEHTVWETYKTGVDPATQAGSTAEVAVIYIGGGNAALLCQSRDIAQHAASVWSRNVLEQAPGLRVSVGYANIENSLAAAYEQAVRNLEACENSLPFGSPLLALPVVRTCTTTSLPAASRSEEEGEWIAREAYIKRAQVGSEDRQGNAQQDIARDFHTVLAEKQHFAVQLEDLGGHEGESHIAIVHADGNRIGALLTKVVENNTADDNAFLHDIRIFSASVARAAHTALLQTMEWFKDFLPLERPGTDSHIFPLRPIVYGGDDLTFVCDGRLGLALTAVYLQKFAQQDAVVMGATHAINACAGVAIVPTKFPFARAYTFAEELCELAKRKNREQDQSGSWIDFQIMPEGATDSIEALRQNQYRTLTGQRLHKRPYQVPEAWETFVTLLQGFRTWPRSRAKGLLQALVQGPVATQHFVMGAHWRQYTLPKSSALDANEARSGWTGGQELQRTTSYFDPLEALDFVMNSVPLALEETCDVPTAERTAP